MNKKNILLIGAIICLILIPWVTFSAAPFYEGKIVRITVGFSPGGGFDLYARAVARHLGKYIPGNPTVIVENMTGAGGVIQVNNIYNVAKPDGLTIGHVLGGLFFGQLLGQPGFDFDTRKFIYIGAPTKENNVIALTKSSGITSIEKWKASKTPVKLGGLIPGNTLDNTPRVLKGVLGYPIQLITGYKGSQEIRLAMESGEVAGGTFTWEALRATSRKSLDSGDVIVVLQAVPQPLPDLPNVPTMISLAKTEEARNLIEAVIHSNIIFNRPFLLPPGTPKDRVEILRKAFQETMKDKEFIAEMEKAKLTLDPVWAEELEMAINRLFKLEPAILAKLKDILFK